MAKIGFIGLGAMGLPMASNLQRKGFNLQVFDLDPERIEAMAALGARAATSVADASREAEIVVTMLPRQRMSKQSCSAPTESSLISIPTRC